MKKFIYSFSLTSLTIFIIANLFRIMHWPGGGALLVISVFSLGFIIIPFLFISTAIEEKNQLKTLESIFGIIGFSGLLLSVLFYTLYWPYAQIILKTGILVTLTGYLPISIYIKSNLYKKDIVNQIFHSCLVILAVISIYATINTNNPHLLDSLKNNIKSSDKTINNLKTHNLKTIKLLTDTLNQNNNYIQAVMQINKITENTVDYINDIKKRLVIVCEGSEEMIDEKINDPFLITSANNYDIPNYFLLGGSLDGKVTALGEKSESEKLRNSLIDFKHNLLLILNNPELEISNKEEELNKLGDFGIFTEDNNEEYINPNDPSSLYWGPSRFYRKNMVSCIVILNNIIENVYLGEQMALNTLVK